MPSTEPTRSLRIVMALLSVLMPILLTAGTFRAAANFRDQEDVREDRNAGRIMNGKVLESGVVQTIERRMKMAEPDVVVLGNSLSNTDLQTGLLAKRLGLPRHKVQKFSVPNSIGAHWFLILKNRVFARGHRPGIVIMLSDLQSALAVTPRTEASQINLTVHYGDEEPELQQKLGSSYYFLDRVRENRAKIRDRILQQARNLSVDLLFWHRMGGDHGRTTNLLTRAFDQSRTDIRLHANVMPAFAQGHEQYAFDPSTLPLPRESLIPEISSLVSAHDGIALFVRPPMSPLLPEDAGDIVLPGVAERVARITERRGAASIDMRFLDMQDGHFYNIDHMNPEGARRFTEAVAMVVKQIIAERQDEAGFTGRQRPREVELFNAVELRDGVLVHVKRDVETYPKRPPDFKGMERPYHRKRKDIGYFEAPGLGFMSDVDTLERSRFAARCSPLRVVESRSHLPLPNATCEELFKHGDGRVCHTRERVFFTAVDSTSPFQNGRRYSLALDPQRSCEAGSWLYPGDQLRVRFHADELQRFGNGAVSLRLEAYEFGPKREGTDLAVKLRVDGSLRVDARFDPMAHHDGLLLPVRPPIRPTAEDVVLTVANNSKEFILLTSAVLSERQAKDASEKP